MHKNCTKCNKPILPNSKGNATCMNCGEYHHQDVYKALSKKYKILWFCKATTKESNAFHNNMKKELKALGHEVILINTNGVLKHTHAVDMIEVSKNQKRIRLRPFEYEHNPDLIFIDQLYTLFKNDCKKTFVIYRQREYTHFMDILDADAIYYGYPMRKEFMEKYYPIELAKTIDAGFLFCGVDLKRFPFKDEPPTFKGIIDIGWNLHYWQLATSNGPVAKMVIADQEKFSDTCKKVGITRRIEPPVKDDVYKEFLRNSEFILIDGGYYGWLTRRIFEAAASKACMCIRIHSKEQEVFYKEIGLKHEKNCILFKNPVELRKYIEYNYTGCLIDDIRENVYKWVQNHTYKKRAEQLLEDIKKWI